ncbi:archaemetzincin-2-like [Mytilus galloprovincialis]|uniref:Archaemetzincin n=1 Tax=Mytilus galloprovincialis TaxID=29158 RepID=A0A8B6BY57_MYTGA|nr:archaemetzincin [Mytilus galloprovincialis]
MGSWFSTQSSESIFLIGKLNGKPADERHFFNLSQIYLDQADGSGDNSNIDTDKNCKTIDSDSLIFKPLPKKKKLFCHQTYVQWRSSLDLEFLKHLFVSPKRVIYLVQINDFPDFVKNFRINLQSSSYTLFQFIEEFLKIYYMGMDVQWLDKINLENTDWNIKERCNKVTEQLQYLVTDFFAPLQNVNPSDGYCIMGMTWTDLYPEEKYNFALGEASCKHKSGVFSFGRCPPSTFDPKNPKDITDITSEILWKLLKVSSHEIGHLFGLEHCEFFLCHMNESLSMDDAMNQPLFYCPVCLHKIQHVCQFSVAERYQKLETFISDIHQQFPSEKWSQSLKFLKKCREFLSKEEIVQ